MNNTQNHIILLAVFVLFIAGVILILVYPNSSYQVMSMYQHNAERQFAQEAFNNSINPEEIVSIKVGGVNKLEEASSLSFEFTPKDQNTDLSGIYSKAQIDGFFYSVPDSQTEPGKPQYLLAVYSAGQEGKGKSFLTHATRVSVRSTYMHQSGQLGQGTFIVSINPKGEMYEDQYDLYKNTCLIFEREK